MNDDTFNLLDKLKLNQNDDVKKNIYTLISDEHQLASYVARDLAIKMMNNQKKIIIFGDSVLSICKSDYWRKYNLININPKEICKNCKNLDEINCFKTTNCLFSSYNEKKLELIDGIFIDLQSFFLINGYKLEEIIIMIDKIIRLINIKNLFFIISKSLENGNDLEALIEPYIEAKIYLRLIDKNEFNDPDGEIKILSNIFKKDMDYGMDRKFCNYHFWIKDKIGFKLKRKIYD